MRKNITIILLVLCAIMFVSCSKKRDVTTESSTAPSQTTNDSSTEERTTENKEETTAMISKMNVQIGDYSFTATLEDNDAVKELVNMMKDAPIVLDLDDYSGFEKVGPLGKNLTRSDKQTTTQSGDIVLYNGNNIVVFYGSNSWSYTRLGKIDDLTNWKKALGGGSVTITFSL